jgi:hypothetical protein
MSDGVYGVSVYLSNALKALREVADVSTITLHDIT